MIERDHKPGHANKGTPMKEWLSLDPEASLPWRPLAREALEFVRGVR